MRALKTEDRQFTSNPGQQPSSSRRKRSRQTSYELSSLEECLVAEKGRENERKWRKEEAAAKLPPIVYCQREVIDVTNLNSSLYTAQNKGNYKKK